MLERETMMRSAASALLLLAAAACSGSAPRNQATQNQPTNQASAANAAESAQDMGARIAALPEPQRLATFQRAINDAGMDCQNVTGAAPGGTYHGMPVWNARCRGGGHWTLVVGSGGTVQILNANEARLLTDKAPRANSAAGR